MCYHHDSFDSETSANQALVYTTQLTAPTGDRTPLAVKAEPDEAGEGWRVVLTPDADQGHPKTFVVRAARDEDDVRGFVNDLVESFRQPYDPADFADRLSYQLGLGSSALTRVCAKHDAKDLAVYYQAVRANPLRTVTIEAYVPNRDREGRLVHNHEHWVRQVEETLAKLSGGGVTTYEARGYWQGGYEHTSVVRASVVVPGVGVGSELTLQDVCNAVAQPLGAFAVETNQELAGFTVDGQWYWAARAEDDADHQPAVLQRGV